MREATNGVAAVINERPLAVRTAMPQLADSAIERWMSSAREPWRNVSKESAHVGALTRFRERGPAASAGVDASARQDPTKEGIPPVDDKLFAKVLVICGSRPPLSHGEFVA